VGDNLTASYKKHEPEDAAEAPDALAASLVREGEMTTAEQVSILYLAECRLYLAECRLYLAECRLYLAECRLYLAECRLHLAECR
jgi:hypothetical protein